MTTLLKITEDDFDSAVDVVHALLHSGGVFVYPTDTVYGIGGDATSREVVEKIHKIKGISGFRPMSVIMADFEMVEYYCETGIWEDIILKKYLPGPYTFILKLRRPIAATNSGKLGVRLPDSAFCQRFCRDFGRPIITTSANITSEKAPTDFGHINKKILDSVDVAIDGGSTKYASPSLVIDLVERNFTREDRAGSKILPISLPEV